MNLFDKKKCKIFDKIVFRNNFRKLGSQKYCYCLRIMELNVNKKLKSTKDFLKYDTEPYDFPIKNGNYLYLLFIGDKGIPFTTLRKNNEENKEKYKEYCWYKIEVIGE